ncbi:hypothetical protein GCM10010978_09920 [Compostibacillus humi]|uniref:HNH nuclease domain-containing protein n=1 Tax=Compostibacillus humi TaxID=1245525 RepID=A0A8J2ZQT9_9BACI|nr:HNH endonuclease [Compostibacillus humi]GGH72733.1 hypothetical protein GCM10010978_09920 [Compostibacillus humi]
MTKVCTNCKTEKKLEQFYAPSRSHCIDCERRAAKERMKRYYATFRGKAAQALNDSRKAVKRIEREQGVKVEDDLTIYEVLWIFSEPCCAYCGKEVPEQDRTLDHITPIKYGGSNTFDNVMMACRSCNSAKADRPVYDFIHRQQNIEATKQLVERVAARRVTSYYDVLDEWEQQATYYHVEQVKERLRKRMREYRRKQATTQVEK